MKNTILIVDDDADFRNYLIDLLEGVSLKIIQAKNGKEALDYFFSEKIDFIISDLEMPEINGLDFLKKVRQKQTDIPFLLTTASLSYSKKEIISLGANFFIQKIDMNIDTIQNLIESLHK